MTRIIGGVAGGRQIRTPPGDSTRPTSDRVREALFSSIESTLGTLHGRSFLDLYAGSGAVGLEAASRGASRVTFVERNRSASALIAVNAETLGFTDLVSVLGVSVEVLEGPPPTGAFDVTFLDPPYDIANRALGPLLTKLADAGWLVPGALVVVERSRRSEQWTWTPEFEAVRDRRYGDTVLWYGHWVPSPDGEPPAPPTRAPEDHEVS